MGTVTLQELAERADVDPGFLQRLIDVGALQLGRAEDEPVGLSDVPRIQLFLNWEHGGFSPEALVELVQAGELSASWLDQAVTVRADQLHLTFEQLCRQQDVPLALMRSVEGALGFAPPEPQDHAQEGDTDLAKLVKVLSGAGVPVARTLGVVRVYADSLRRIAKAEAELYESEVEQPLRRSGRSEQELLDFSGTFGDDTRASLERIVLAVYRRQREHVWLEHCIGHAEAALERSGLRESVARRYAICFVDLTNYVRITEERGDEVAAGLATTLTSLVEDISRCHAGRPVRWLGDGGMFLFKDPAAALSAGLDMVERAPRVGLPEMHLGIHRGPVVFQDGDIYGKAVNLAARIASHAGPGEVLASGDTMACSPGSGVDFEPLGPVSLHGLSIPVELFRAVRRLGQ